MALRPYHRDMENKCDVPALKTLNIILMSHVHVKTSL